MTIYPTRKYPFESVDSNKHQHTRFKITIIIFKIESENDEFDFSNNMLKYYQSILHEFYKKN